MRDRKRMFLGFGLLLVALIGAGVAGVGGWIGRDLRTGAVLGLAVFLFFGAIAAYQFIKIRDWAWIPAVLGGVYAILPDLMLGPGDDIGAILIGAVLSGVLTWRRGKRDELEG